MYVIEVIPLSRTAPGMLSYRSKDMLPAGSIVNIVIRKTETQGIVVDCVPVSEAKEMLKNARFMLSKSTPSPAGILPDEILNAAKETAEYHATSAGAVLTAAFGEYIRMGVPLPTEPLQHGNSFNQIVCEKPFQERAEIYFKHIEEHILLGQSVLLVAPTLPELVLWKDSLKKFKPLVLSSALTGKKRTQALASVASYSGLIITTPAFAWVPVQNLGLYILDRISSGTYTLPKRPYLSMVYAVEMLARARELPLVLGDYPLPLEYRLMGKVELIAPANPVEVHDARSKDDKEQETTENTGPWRAIPREIIERIHSELNSGGRAVVLGTRKGYSPAVVCKDCGQAQTDESGIPLIFTAYGGNRAFMTNDGKTMIDSKRPCQRCASWNLLPLGIGIERIYEELRDAFPSVQITLASPDLLTSSIKAKDMALESRFAGSITVCTEAFLPWLYAYGEEEPKSRKPLGIIASADSLLALPFWRARERFVRLAYFFSGVTNSLILVTRRPEDSAVKTVEHSESITFWEEEKMLREALLYPPFGTIITLTFEGGEKASAEFAVSLNQLLKGYNPFRLPARMSHKNMYKQVVGMILAKDSWPDKELIGLIQRLPPSVRVRIDPEAF